jgi:putative Holliday junction resolvase
MAIQKLEDFAANCKQGVRLLGLDLGDRRIGIAYGDFGTGIVTPLGTIERTGLQNDSTALKKYINDYEISCWVVGWPLNMDGSEGPKCQSVKDTVLALLKITGDFPVLLQDERLTTSESMDFLIDELDMTRAKRSKVIDKMSARLILEGAVQKLHEVKTQTA